MAKKQSVFYTLDSLLELGNKDKDIKYFIAFGERSAGKSYSAGLLAIKTYYETGGTTGIARRYSDDWGSNVAQTYFDAIVYNGDVEKATNGDWNTVAYYARKWYLAYFDEESQTTTKDNKPFAYALALNTWEKSKGGQFPTMKYLVMEEFITNTRYLGSENTEFQYFLNLVSTLARNREDFNCILLGNTLAKYGNPYFICMGIEKRVLAMKPGETVVFSTDNKKLKIAVEFTDPPAEGKKSDILFDFTDNAAARQITSGEWQLDPKFPCLPSGTRIKPMDIIFSYFMIYRNMILQADIVLQGDKYYTFYHRKTTELKDDTQDIIFDLDYHIEPNYRRDILHPTDNISIKIADFFKRDMIFCQDAEVAEILYSYICSV